MCDIIFPAVQISIPFLFILLNKYNSRTLNLNGKVAVVTNGSNGLGQKICMTLAQYGCNIVIVDILPAHETLQKLKGYDVKAMAFRVNISHEQEVAKVMKDVMTEFGAVDILINNATLVSYKTLFEHTDGDVEKITMAKICGVKNMTNFCVEIMKNQRSGNIITLSGTNGLSAFPFDVDLTYAKFKILKYMNGIKRSLRGKEFSGIDVTCISPNEDSLINEKIDTTDYLTADEYTKMVVNCIDGSILSKLRIKMM